MADPIWSTSRPLPRKNRAGWWLLNLFDLFQSLAAAAFKHPLLKAFTIGVNPNQGHYRVAASQIGRLMSTPAIASRNEIIFAFPWLTFGPENARPLAIASPPYPNRV
jgi:hypothetical protein